MSGMLEFGFVATKGLEKVEKNLVEVEVPFLNHNSDEDRGSSVSREEGMRKAQRILEDPALESMRMEGMIRKAPWVLLDPTEELLGQPELKPCHHSTPLMPSSSGNLNASLRKRFGISHFRGVLHLSYVC